MNTNAERWNNFSEEQKLAYLAGLIDGEGCITLSPHGGGLRPIIQLQMTCKETVQRFADYFGLGVRECNSPSRQNPKWKQLFQTRAECLKAYPIIKKLQPFLFTKIKDCEEPLKYYEGRVCVCCGVDIPISRNKKSTYCSPGCQKRSKNRRSYRKQKGAD